MTENMRIRGIDDLLRRVEKPARYAGGEYGSVRKPGEAALSVLISYPDLYEIGMSNSAVRILYRALNGIEGVACERVFAPAPDLEAELRKAGMPLFSLETRRPVSAFDIIGFSIGFELTLTNVFTILETGGVPILREQRREEDPIVIAGGPAITNPAPFGPFIDCLFMGEAEGWLEETFSRMAAMKKSGAGRNDILAYLRSMPPVWHEGKSQKTVRAVWRGFPAVAAISGLPVPNLRTVQDHGTVEIMRGCPNACRFCHATCLYRPVRMKRREIVEKEVRALVHGSGYREITLSSLSSGNFAGIGELVSGLNAAYASKGVSFSLPSLHVDSLSLSLLAGISEVRKSGLTFAVETPKSEWQVQIGKSVTLEKTVALMLQAKSLGWKMAKFYFMVGLPASFSEDESGPIIEFLREVRQQTGMGINVNVAAFIPKPHTPFERAAQLTEGAALEKIMAVKKSLRGDGFKIGYHAPFLSFLEGIVSRGDERAGRLVFAAYRDGARLDAWEEYIRPDVWRAVIQKAGWDVEAETCRGREKGESLPWDGVGLDSVSAVGFGDSAQAAGQEAPRSAPPSAPERAGEEKRVIFSFSKSGSAAFASHLDLMQIFERAFARAGLDAVFTQGFNPKPRLEFASPLGLGIESEEEAASLEIKNLDSGDAFISAMNPVLPEGIRVTGCAFMDRLPSGKKPSLMAAYWGSEYRIRTERLLDPAFLDEMVRGTAVRAESRPDGAVLLAPAEPATKELILKLRADPSISLSRVRVLARGKDGAPVSYFEAFRSSSLT